MKGCGNKNYIGKYNLRERPPIHNIHLIVYK